MQQGGYKANRRSVSERRLESRKRVWRESDVPSWWAKGQLADANLIEEAAARLVSLGLAGARQSNE